MKQMEFAGSIIRVEEADPGLIIGYWMIPMLTVPVLGHVYQHASVAAMMMSQSRASVWMSGVLSSHY